MGCTTAFIDYEETGYFSSLMMDYLREDSRLKPFYEYSPNQTDFKKVIHRRRENAVDRTLLVNELQRTYSDIDYETKVAQNIQSLVSENTFTVCTAHQPNLFTGYLYFVYKVLHAVKLAESLKERYPKFHFVPVYYMGSEDNDLEELGTINLYGKAYHWETAQTGAVGRMESTELTSLIEKIAGELGNNDYAQEIVGILKKAYLEHKDIQTATLYIVNALFGRFGLVIVNADSPGFKNAILPVMEEDLFLQKSVDIVNETKQALSKHYHAQANPRAINLFYLKDQLRERIVKEGTEWKVLNTDISFDKKQLEKELQHHPERFSPNVILRGILQESILPNVAFIGGGGELAYWLELKNLFAHFEVPFPPLLLRHSVLWADRRSIKRIEKIGLQIENLFKETEFLIKNFVKENTNENLQLAEESKKIKSIFQEIKKRAGQIDRTLEASVGAEQTKALHSIEKIEKKFLRAEKKKFDWQTALIREVKSCLFPKNGLQERVDNILPFYAVYGSRFLDDVYESLELNNKFTIIKEGE